MKHHCVCATWIVLLLTIAIVLVSCGEDPKQEQERVRAANNLNEICSKYFDVTIYSHGPRNTYMTFSYEFPILDLEEEAKSIASELIPQKIIDLGFTKIYFVAPNAKVEAFVNRAKNRWEIK